MAGVAKKVSKLVSAVCKKDVGKKDNGIQCDACEEWFHSQCQNITDEHYSVFGQYKSIHWYCAQCNVSVAKLWKAVSNITARQDKLDLELEKLNNRMNEIKVEEQHLAKIDQELASLRDELKGVVEKVLETDTKVETAIEAKLMEGLENKVDGRVKILKEDMEESQEIERRKVNLVFHGVKELHRAKPEDDGKEHDREMIEEILRVGLKLDPSRHIEEVYRIGRYDGVKIEEGKTRPVRIKVKTIEGRTELLKRARELKTSGFSRVFIAPDLTRKQQVIDKELREKLKELKSKVDDGEKSMLRIKSGKIVKNETGKQEIIVYQPIQNVKQ